MSQELVAAITSAQSDPTVAIERHRTQMETADMNKMNLSATPVPEGGAAIQLGATAIEPPKTSMNLQALAGSFSDGLKNGFYADDMNRLMTKLSQSKDATSGITAGDVTVELLNVQAKVGIADAFSKVTSKLSEGLQTMVVKQG
jgi:hypothetical protein